MPLQPGDVLTINGELMVLYRIIHESRCPKSLGKKKKTFFFVFDSKTKLLKRASSIQHILNNRYQWLSFGLLNQPHE